MSCLGRFSCSLASQIPYSVNQHLSWPARPLTRTISLSHWPARPLTRTINLSGRPHWTIILLIGRPDPTRTINSSSLAGQTKITLIFTSFSYLYIDMFLHIDHTPHQNHDNETNNTYDCLDRSVRNIYSTCAVQSGRLLHNL